MTIRPFDDTTDLNATLDLFATSLSRTGQDDWFRWKHRTSPFGPSPGYVAEQNGRILGARFFLRWQFRDGARTIEALRPVDTVTHPDARGQGIFKRLTLHGLQELSPERDPLIFNTPNSNSLPGYLKMGWQRLPQSFVYAYCLRGSGRGPAVRITDELPTDAFAEPDYPTGVLTTHRNADFLRWRYRAKAYRFASFAAGEGAGAGAMVFRNIKVKGIGALAVADYAGPAERARTLIDATARKLGRWVVYILDGGATPAARWPLHYRRGSSLVAVRTAAEPANLTFDLSAGDLESIL